MFHLISFLYGGIAGGLVVGLVIAIVSGYAEEKRINGWKDSWVYTPLRERK